MANPLKQIAEPRPKRSPEEICADANAAMLANPEGRRDVHWYAHNGEVRIGWNVGEPRAVRQSVFDRPRGPMTADETDALNRYLEVKGSAVRYRSDGARMLSDRGG